MGAHGLVFTFEDDDANALHSVDRSTAERVQDDVSRICRPQGQFHVQLLRDAQACSGDVVTSVAARLAGLSYRVRVRKALGGGDDYFRNLRHEFLVVQGRGDADGQEFLVEQNLKEHFVIPHRTPLYDVVVQSIPAVFVGTRVMLQDLVQYMCDQMERSFVEKDLTCPPWRKPTAVMSKWCPARRKLQDHIFSDNGSVTAVSRGSKSLLEGGVAKSLVLADEHQPVECKHGGSPCGGGDRARQAVLDVCYDTSATFQPGSYWDVWVSERQPSS